MRYARGSVVITADRDIPLLRQVRNSRFVSHQQLFEMLQYDAVASCRSSFNWRVQRLLRTGLIERLEPLCRQGALVYTVTHHGLLELESQGDFAIALHSGTRQMPHRAQVFHAIELNEIRLALIRSRLLGSWQSEVEISSMNMVSSAPYQKDYDAVVKIWVGNELREFALEYERSLKSAKQYAGVRAALEAERQIGCILYLTVNPVLQVALLHQLTPMPQHLGFATARSFKDQLLAASVTTQANRAMITLKEFLEFSHPLYMRA